MIPPASPSSSSPSRYVLSSPFLLLQGMSKFEVLSRGSLFFVPTKKLKSHKFHVISAAHIPYPFNFPKLYPQSRPDLQWLSFVTEADTKLTVQLRHEKEGTLLSEHDLLPRTFAKTGADLIVMHLENEETFLNDLQAQGIELTPLKLSRLSVREYRSKSLTMVGHDFQEAILGEQADPASSTLRPLALDGEINLFAQPKLFVNTDTPSMMGLCGGPVFFRNGDPTEVMGMVEALVQPLPPNHQLDQSSPQFKILTRIQNNTVVIPSDEIAAFVDQVEEEA